MRQMEQIRCGLREQVDANLRLRWRDVSKHLRVREEEVRHLLRRRKESQDGVEGRMLMKTEFEGEEKLHLLLKFVSYTLFFYKNHAYKNVEAQITPKNKNIVVILLVAISISFPASDEI